MQLLNDSSNPPAGHYSSAVIHKGFVFLSGVLPPPGLASDFEQETLLALEACKRILLQTGCNINDVVQCTAYIVGVENWPRFNAVYASFFEAHKPARTVVPVQELHHGCLVEVQMIAAIDQQNSFKNTDQ